MNTSELTGADLDYWVAKAEGFPKGLWWHSGHRRVYADQEGRSIYRPSSVWSEGGPIIERERITVAASKQGWGWLAYTKGYWLNEALSDYECEQYGETYLEAAMRAYVASKLGEEVGDIL